MKPRLKVGDRASAHTQECGPKRVQLSERHLAISRQSAFTTADRIRYPGERTGSDGHENDEDRKYQKRRCCEHKTDAECSLLSRPLAVTLY